MQGQAELSDGEFLPCTALGVWSMSGSVCGETTRFASPQIPVSRCGLARG